MNKNTAKSVTQKLEMSNGGRLLIREDHSMPTVSISVYFLGGRRNETVQTNGVGKLAQRLMSKGTREFSANQIAEELENLGIAVSPLYGMDVTGMQVKFVSRHFDKALDLFYQIVTEPAFSQSEFDKERDNLLEAIRKQKDNPLGYCLNMCQEVVFENHPYGLWPNGTLDSVGSLTREDVVKYHEDVYNSKNMVIAVVGDIKADSAEESINKYFSHIKDTGNLTDPGEISGPIKNIKEKSETSEKQQVAISVGFHAPILGAEEYYTFRILNQLLSGMGSRLFLELRDKMGLAYNVGSSYSGHISGGIFQAYILTGFSQKERARLALLEEIDRLRTRLAPYDELVRAKHYHLGLFDIDMQSNSATASRIAYNELVGLGYDFVEEYNEKIKRITRQKIKRTAEKYLKPQSYAIALLTPSTYPKTPQ